MRWILCFLFAVGAAVAAEPPLRILFLGNSYTYYNNLAGLVEGMARRPVEAVSVTRGGATLGELFLHTRALEVLRGGRWDVVVLQEQSTLGVNQFNGDMVVNDPAAFWTWARIWDYEIRRAGARTVFFIPWARKGRGELQPHIDWAYATIAKELQAGLMPVGTAFGLVSQAELFAPDGTHPSAAGSYVAACVAVEVLAGGGCEGAAGTVMGPLMDNATGVLRGERGELVRLGAEAEGLQRAALGAVARLQAEGGYWRLGRPVFAGEAELTGAGGAFAGRWEGVSWQYGKKANVTLQLAVVGGACSGTWQVVAAEPLTQTLLPLEGCSVADGWLRFTVKPLWLASEMHQAKVDGAKLQGRVVLQNLTPYHRQTGTWTLQRVKP